MNVVLVFAVHVMSFHAMSFRVMLSASGFKRIGVPMDKACGGQAEWHRMEAG